MKSYLPIAIAAGLVILGLAAAAFLTPALAPPQARVQDEIADDIARAQAMLAAYSPTDAALLRQLDTSVSTQPAAEPAAGLSSQEREAFKARLAARQNLIDDALRIVQSAIGTQIGDASGSSSPAATRLEALLLVEKAQIARRTGGLEWRLAANARTQVRDLLAHWAGVDSEIRSIESVLEGRGTLPGKSMTAPSDATAATTEATQQEHSRLGTLIGSLLGNRPSEAATTSPAPDPGTAASPQTVEAPAQTPPTAPSVVADPACTLTSTIQDILARQTQSPQQRIADLRLCRAQVEQRLAEAQHEVEVLTPQVQELTRRIEAARAQADAARKEMLALEQTGVDATQPGSLEQFTEAYTRASGNYRRALRTISILTSGAGAEPRLKPEEQEMLLEPAIPVDPEVEQQQRGLTALEADLAAARTVIDKSNQMLTLIDKSIERLSASDAELKEYVTGLRARRERIAGELASAAREAISHVVAACAQEEAALEVLSGAAPAAAGRAQRAAREPGDRTASAAAQALDGDIAAARAMTLAQQAIELEKHAELLERLEPVGIPVEQLTPQADESAPTPWATQAAAARTQAQAQRDAARQAANEAIEAYAQAANTANNRWTIHTEIAAMHYLLGNLSTGDEAEKHFADARRVYDLATRDRRDRPEVQPLRSVYERLAQAR